MYFGYIRYSKFQSKKAIYWQQYLIQTNESNFQQKLGIFSKCTKSLKFFTFSWETLFEKIARAWKLHEQSFKTNSLSCSKINYITKIDDLIIRSRIWTWIYDKVRYENRQVYYRVMNWIWKKVSCGKWHDLLRWTNNFFLLINFTINYVIIKFSLFPPNVFENCYDISFCIFFSLLLVIVFIKSGKHPE